MPSGVLLTLQQVKDIAKAKGGRFHSKAYHSARTPYVWSCANGHRWIAPVTTIRNNGSWCPYCAKGSGEECVRICFEKIFRRSFPKARPIWLKSRNGRSLELDGFNRKMAVAFEHQGRHHYQYRSRFHKDDADFRHRIKLDRRKSRLCDQHGVRLVKIPEVGWKFSLEDLLKVVINICRQKGIKVPLGAGSQRINYAPAYNMNRKRAKGFLLRLKAAAKEKGGICFDRVWHGWVSKYSFRCNRGHRWTTQPAGIISENRWCVRCRPLDHSKKQKKWWSTRGGNLLRQRLIKKGQRFLLKLNQVARSRGGSCLAKTWTGWRSKYRFRCGKCGKEWNSVPQNIIKRGANCKSCVLRERHASNRKRRDYFGQMQRFATQKGGKCLDSSWKGWANKYRFRCGKCRREWSTSGSSILSRRTWCKPCAIKKVWKLRKSRSKRRSPFPT